MKPLPFTRFCSDVLRFRLTNGQRVFALVAFDGVDPIDLPMADDRAIARALFGDVDTIDPAARRVIAAVLGRGSGKTLLGGYRGLHAMLTSPATQLAEGEHGFVLVVAPDKATARQFVRFALGAAKATPSIRSLIVAEGNDGFTLRRPDGKLVTLEAIACSRAGAAGRGRTILLFVLDESAFFYDEEHARNDADTFRALIPRLVRNGQALVLSTPWVDLGLLHELYSRNIGAPSTALACRAPTLTMRDNDPEVSANVELEKQRDPDNAKREFDCEWLTTGSSSFFDPAMIDSCVDDTLARPAPPFQGVQTWCAADFGFRRDSSAIAVLQRGTDRLAVNCIEELRPKPGAPLVPSIVVKRFAEIVRGYGGAGLLTDGHYLETVREHLTSAGLNVYLAPEGVDGKSSQYIAARELVHMRAVRFPVNQRLISQLKAITTKPLPGGGVRIESPRRAGVQGHGDIASAVVLTLWGAKQDWMMRARAEQSKNVRRAMANFGYCDPPPEDHPNERRRSLYELERIEREEQQRKVTAS